MYRPRKLVSVQGLGVAFAPLPISNMAPPWHSSQRRRIEKRKQIDYRNPDWISGKIHLPAALRHGDTLLWLHIWLSVWWPNVQYVTHIWRTAGPPAKRDEGGIRLYLAVVLYYAVWNINPNYWQTSHYYQPLSSRRWWLRRFGYFAVFREAC